LSPFIINTQLWLELGLELELRLELGLELGLVLSMDLDLGVELGLELVNSFWIDSLELSLNGGAGCGAVSGAGSALAGQAGLPGLAGCVRFLSRSIPWN